MRRELPRCRGCSVVRQALQINRVRTVFGSAQALRMGRSFHSAQAGKEARGDLPDAGRMSARHPEPLPNRLRFRTFHVSEARALGLGWRRLNGVDLARPFHGVRMHTAASGSELDPADPADTARTARPQSANRVERVRSRMLQRARSYLPLMRKDMAFTHLTAALVWRLPVPFAFVAGGQWQSPEELSVGVPAGVTPPRRPGVQGHRLPASAAVFTVEGLPVCDPLTAWWMLCDVPGYTDGDLVAVGDFVVCRRELRSDGRAPFAGVEEVLRWASALRGRHCRRLRRAAVRVRDASQSPMETLTRLLLVDAGLPEPELNVDVYGTDGTFIGRADALYRVQRVVVEFDGDQHRTSRVQYARDRERLQRFRDDGYRLVQMVSDDLRIPARRQRVADLVRAALIAGAT